jgi:hypothetical protein
VGEILIFKVISAQKGISRWNNKIRQEDTQQQSETRSINKAK